MPRFWCFILTQFKASCLLLSGHGDGLSGTGQLWFPALVSERGVMRIRDWVAVDVQHPLTFVYRLPLFFVTVAHLLAKPVFLADLHLSILRCHGAMSHI